MKQILIATLLALSYCISCNTTTKQPEADQNTLSATTNLQEDIKQRNKQIALQCINAWSKGDIDKIVSNLAEGSVDYGDGSTLPARGIDSVRFFAQLWNSSVKDYKADNELAVADSNFVFVYAGWSGTFKSDFMGMKTTGKSFKFRDVDMFKFNDAGKITEHRAVNFSMMLKQLASE